MPAWNPARVDFPEWIRRTVLTRDPICAVCHSRLATEVDHVVGFTECLRQGRNPNVLGNAQSICADCHAVKTQAERTAGIRATFAKLRHPGS